MIKGMLKLFLILLITVIWLFYFANETINSYVISSSLGFLIVILFVELIEEIKND